MKSAPLEVKVNITNIEEFKVMLTAAVDLLNALDDTPMAGEVSARASTLREALGSVITS
jgi:hypothetical protein